MSEPGFLHHCFQMFPCLPCKRKPNPEVSKLKQARQKHSQMFSIPKMLNQRHKTLFSEKSNYFQIKLLWSGQMFSSQMSCKKISTDNETLYLIKCCFIYDVYKNLGKT